MQTAHVTHGGAAKKMPLARGDGLRRPAELLVFTGFDLDKNQDAALPRHQVNFIPAADPHAPADDCISPALQFRRRPRLTP